MEIGQIEAFLAVVREGSFTNAAVRLSLTQPSLSARIHQLEQNLGGELFHRDKRPVQLTSLGDVFIDYAERATELLEAGYEAVHSTRLGVTGRVSVCSPFSLASYLLPEVVDRFSQAHPQAELYVETGHSDFAVNQLLEGFVNLALAAAFPRYMGQTQSLLRLHDEMVVAVSPKHELALEKNIPIQTLWQYRSLVVHWGTAFTAYIRSLRQMVHAQGSLVRVPLAVALPMAQQTDTVVFLPKRLTAVSKLAILDVPGFQFDWDAVLLTRPGRTPTVLEQSFVDMVATVWKSGAP